MGMEQYLLPVKFSQVLVSDKGQMPLLSSYIARKVGTGA